MNKKMKSIVSIDNLIYSVCGKDLLVNEKTLISELNLDSLSTLDLFNQIYHKYNIEIDVNEFILCRSIEDLRSLIQNKISD